MPVEPILDMLVQLKDAIGAQVVTLYRETYSHDLEPVLVASDSDAKPPRISDASDLALVLRSSGDEPAIIHSDTYLDTSIRNGFEAFGINTLISRRVPARPQRGRYYMTIGYHDPRIEPMPEHTFIVVGTLARIASRIDANPEMPDEQMPDPSPVDASPLAIKAMHTVTQRISSCEDMAELVSDLSRMIESPVLFEDMEGVVVNHAGADPDSPAPDSSRATIIRQGRLQDLEKLDRMRKTMYLDEGSGAMRRVLPVKNLRELYGFLTVIIDEPRTFWRHELICQYAALQAALIMSDRDRRRHSMLRNTLNASEAERARIAQDLQDQTSQNLVALKVLLSCAQTAAEHKPEDVSGLVEDAACVADEILTSINHTTAELRPNELDYLGLGVAIDTYATRKLAKGGCAFELEGNAVDLRFDPLTELTLLKVAQEAIRNVAKHATATHCVVSIEQKEGYLTLVIWDNGRGFDTSGLDLDRVSHKRYGLKTMHDKVEMLMGSLWIGSEPGIGTKVIARVPLPTRV